MRLIKFIHSGILINGLKQGRCIKIYNRRGNKHKNTYKNTYKNNILHGDIVRYLNSAIACRTSYKYGYKHGREVWYNAKGSIANVNIYSYDVLRGREIYSGVLIREKQIYNITQEIARQIDQYIQMLILM